MSSTAIVISIKEVKQSLSALKHHPISRICNRESFFYVFCKTILFRVQYFSSFSSLSAMARCPATML
jgi:hypothetical protein